MFLQIHTLTTYAASLLNRDDAGLAKRIPFGNATRLRVSSQCLKRNWREDMAESLPDMPDGLRTRSFFTRCVAPRAVALGVPEAMVHSLLDSLAKAVIDGGVKDGGDLAQPVLFGVREADYFASMIRDASVQADPSKALTERLKSKDEKANLIAMGKAAAGLAATLFGRMVTSDILARVDAPVHVAHAFTVHAANTEMDYFTVVDDLNRDDETGAAHANQSELGAGLYYGYVVIDVPLLVSNLTGCDRKDWRAQDPAATRRVIDALVMSVLQQSPGAKLGSTAPYAWADLMLLEVGDTQPRSLANAFLQALEPKGDMRARAAESMVGYVSRLDRMYGEDGVGHRVLSTSLELAGQAGWPPVKPVREALATALAGVWS